MLSERLLIARLITSAGLALLLMVGIAAMDHTESEGPAPVSLAAIALLDPHDDPLGDEPGDVVKHGAAVADPAAASALVGAALCILGVLCGLVFVVAAGRLWNRRALPSRSVQPRAPSIFPCPIVRPRATALSLTQLGLSRT